MEIPSDAFNLSGVNASAPFGVRVSPVSDSELNRIGGLGNAGKVLSSVIGVTLSSDGELVKKNDNVSDRTVWQ